MINYNDEALPQELRDKVRMELVKLHAPLLAKRGVTHGTEMLKDRLTQEEKLLASFYAVSIAHSEERYSRIPELSGMCLYGFASCGMFDLAKDFVKASIDPESGGTTEICSTFLLNLSWLEKVGATGVAPSNLTLFVDEARAIVVKQLAEKSADLYNVSRLLRRREFQNMFWGGIQFLLKLTAVIMAAILAAKLGQFLGQ